MRFSLFMGALFWSSNRFRRGRRELFDRQDRADMVMVAQNGNNYNIKAGRASSVFAYFVCRQRIQLQVCADKGAKNMDLVLHDLSGKELLRDESADREPTLMYKPVETATYYVAVQAPELNFGSDDAGLF